MGASKLGQEWRGYPGGRGAGLKRGPQRHLLFALGDLLYAVGLGLRGAAHGGDEFLVSAQDLLRLHGNLLLALHDLDLNLFLPDLLLLTRPLQLISQLGLSRLWRGRVGSTSEAAWQSWALSPKPGTPDSFSP